MGGHEFLGIINHYYFVPHEPPKYQASDVFDGDRQEASFSDTYDT